MMSISLFVAALKIFWVDAYSSEVFLPDADPTGGVVTNVVSLAAAQGEIESVSFVACPDRDEEKVDFVPSDLIGPGGAKIAAELIDFSLVKVWFRPKDRWWNSFRGDLAHPALMNNLILHDDALVKVDFENQVNYLRADYPDGTRYLDMSHTDKKTAFQYDLQPVADAPKFVPMNLRKDFRQQFWVTVKVPKDAKPGLYRGAIAVERTEDGRRETLETLRFEAEIYPFALPNPKTHYDTSRPYVSYWMGVPNLEGLVQSCRSMERAERKARVIYRSLKEHNAVNISNIGKVRSDSLDDLAVRTLLLMRQEGLCARPIINGAAFGERRDFIHSNEGKPRDPKEEAEAYRQTLAECRRYVEFQNGVFDKYLGHHECYYSSIDECGTGTNRRSLGYWAVIKELGGFIWTDSSNPYDMGVFVDMNDVAAFCSHREAGHWHAPGSRAVTYAGTFTGPECPDIWRRTKGMRYWYADFDGLHEYTLFEGENRWNDFVFRGKYCQFGIVYLTRDGLVSTLAWEGVREGLDDVRYFTLLRRRAQAALASRDPATARLGKEAIHWQDSIDPEYVFSLDEHRRATVGWIRRLIAKMGPEPEEPDTELKPVALPPCKPSREELALQAAEKLVADESAPVSERVKSALAASVMRSELLDRPAAVKVLDKLLACPQCSQAERGRLLLAKVNALMTEVVFEEAFTRKQLDEAVATLKRALRMPGVLEKERYEAIQRMADGYLAAGEWQAAIDFAEGRLADTNLSNANRAWIEIAIAAGWKGLKEWKKACQAYRKAHVFYDNDKDGNFLRKICWVEAEAAERCEDWILAQRCYTLLVPCYSSEEASDRNRAIEKAERMTELVRKTQKIAPGSMSDDDAADISLDE